MPIDVGTANGKPFFNVASVGVSARISRALRGRQKRTFGPFAYAMAALQVLGKARSFHVEIEADDGTILRRRAMLVSIGNGRRYGGLLTVHATAAPNDGLLDVVVIELDKGWRFFPLLPALIRGRYRNWQPITAFKTRRARLRTRIRKSSISMARCSRTRRPISLCCRWRSRCSCRPDPSLLASAAHAFSKAAVAALGVGARGGRNLTKGVVIIGGGHGGSQTAASLRSEGYEGPITLISAEPDIPYQRPPLSKTYLKEPEKGLQELRPEAFYTSHNIDLRLSTEAVSIDRQGQTVALNDGSEVPYDHLVLAVGSRPRIPPISGHGARWRLRPPRCRRHAASA